MSGAPLQAISCPTSSLCVAGGPRFLVTSTDPAAGAASWQPVIAPAPVCALPTGPTPGGYFCPTAPSSVTTLDIQSLSCPSMSLCVAAGGNGGPRMPNEILISTDPTGGPSAWKLMSLPGNGGIRSVSCTPTPMCVAISGKNDVLTTTNPTGGPSAWETTDVYPYAPTSMTMPNAVACVPGLCTIAGEDGYILAATDPTQGLAAWIGNQIESRSPLSGVACVSNKLCVAYEYGFIMSSTHPARGSGGWRLGSVVHGSRTLTPLDSATCTPTGFCAIAGGEYRRSGIIITNTNPARHPRSWKQARVDKTLITTIACPTSALCVAADEHGNILTAHP